MCASPFKVLRAGPPPPRVAVLPDALFFVRALPVIADPATDLSVQTAEVTTQVELALEAQAPFPLAQLYHGFYWSPGSDRALAFAAYRRRFTAEQTAAWANAELVLPAFATVFGADIQPATTVVLAAPEGLTAIHWDSGKVPAGVWFQPLPPDATEEDRARTREDLLRRVESKTIVDLEAAPAVEPRRSDREMVFRSGDFVSRLPADAVKKVDVRDKDELGALRRAQGRDILFWRVGMACVAVFVLLFFGEIALFGGGMWLQTRRLKLNAQASTVDDIMARQEIANRTSDLSTKVLLPIEMINAVGTGKAGVKPDNVIFLSATATTDNLYALTISAQTTNPADLEVYLNNLRALPECDNVMVKKQGTVGNLATITFVVTFKSGAIKPAIPAS